MVRTWTGHRWQLRSPRTTVREGEIDGRGSRRGRRGGRSPCGLCNFSLVTHDAAATSANASSNFTKFAPTRGNTRRAKPGTRTKLTRHSAIAPKLLRSRSPGGCSGVPDFWAIKFRASAGRAQPSLAASCLIWRTPARMFIETCPAPRPLCDGGGPAEADEAETVKLPKHRADKLPAAHLGQSHPAVPANSEGAQSLRCNCPEVAKHLLRNTRFGQIPRPPSAPGAPLSSANCLATAGPQLGRFSGRGATLPQRLDNSYAPSKLAGRNCSGCVSTNFSVTIG